MQTKLYAKLSFFMLVLLAPLSLLAADYYVAPTASGTGDCSSPANACELQVALDTAAGNGEDDTIHLAAGSYDASTATFTYQPTDPENYALTLEGAGTDATVLDGGGANQILNINITGLADDANSHITIKGMTLQNAFGRGLYVLTRSAHITVEDSNLSGNSAGAHGGGAYAGSDSGTITLINNIFSKNFALGGGGAAVHSVRGAAMLINNIFSKNFADNYGGGAGAWSYSGTVTLINNTFSKNYADDWGGGIFVFLSGNNAMVNMFNNIVWNNNATNGGDMYVSDDGDRDRTGATFNLFNNDYSDFTIEDGDYLSQGNNINEDPLFIDPDNDDFHLQDGSPCIDKGELNAPELPDTDFEGDDRIIGDAPDVGADEFALLTIEDILEFFDESVEEGSLKGRGRGWLARLRLCFMREMLVMAGKFIEHDRTRAACFILGRAYERCDGEPRPSDFVVGEAVPVLADMINGVRASLGCD